MSFKTFVNNLFSGANSTNSAGSNPVVGAPALEQSIKASAIPGQFTAGAGRDTGVTLAQAQQTNPALQPAQAPQAQSLEAQIKSLFARLDPRKALNLLMELMRPFMGMLGIGPAPATAATKTEQASAPQTQTSQAQDPLTLQAIDEVMAQFGQGQTPQGQTPQIQMPQEQDPQTLQLIDAVMAKFGQEQAQQAQKDTPASTDDGFAAMIQDLLDNQTSQPGQTVRLASNQDGISAPVLEKDLSKPA